MTAISASQREKMAGGPGGPEVSFAESAGGHGLASDTNIDVQVTREMRIENEAAGSVIGKGGQKVGEIRKISGAQVKLLNYIKN